MAGKTWWQEREGAGHMASALKKQRQINNGVSLTSFFLVNPGPQPLTFGVCLPVSLSPV